MKVRATKSATSQICKTLPPIIMTKHPLDIFADDWKSNEEKYFADQPASTDFFEINLTGNTKTGSQIKEWQSPKSIEVKKRMDNWDWSKPYVADLTAEPEIKIFDRLLSSNEIPETLPDFGYFELYKSSKLTDFISGSFLEQYGLIINDKTKDILNQFNIGLSKFYPLTLEFKGQYFTNYYFVKAIGQADNYIDYEKSVFYEQTGLFGFDTRTEIELNSKNEISEYRKNNAGKDKHIFAKKIFLNSNFPKLDYFTLTEFGIYKKFISVKLAKALDKATGIEIKQTNRLYK